jgi:hypothetical protein
LIAKQKNLGQVYALKGCPWNKVLDGLSCNLCPEGMMSEHSFGSECLTCEDILARKNPIDKAYSSLNPACGVILNPEVTVGTICVKGFEFSEKLQECVEIVEEDENSFR